MVELTRFRVCRPKKDFGIVMDMLRYDDVRIEEVDVDGEACITGNTEHFTPDRWRSFGMKPNVIEKRRIKARPKLKSPERMFVTTAPCPRRPRSECRGDALADVLWELIDENVRIGHTELEFDEAGNISVKIEITGEPGMKEKLESKGLDVS